MIQRLRASILNLLWSDKVRPYVWVFYSALWIWGFYGTVFAAPATYVYPLMGRYVYNVWIWLHLVGTSIVMIAMRIEDRARVKNDSSVRNRLWRIAIQMQTAGHGCMFFVLIDYEISAITEMAWGEGVYSVFALAPYTLGCLLLFAQNLTKIVTGRFV